MSEDKSRVLLWQTIPNINNPFRKEREPDGTGTLAFKQLVKMAPSCCGGPQLKKSSERICTWPKIILYVQTRSKCKRRSSKLDLIFCYKVIFGLVSVKQSWWFFSHSAQSQQHVDINTNYISHSVLAVCDKCFCCWANHKCLEFITTDCQFLILGNIQAYSCLCGFFNLSTTQLFSQSVSLVYFWVFYSSLCISYITTRAHVCI